MTNHLRTVLIGVFLACATLIAAVGISRHKIDTAGERLSEALAEVKRRAPKARVYVVGYPAILPAHGSGCADDLTLAPGEATYLHDKEQQLNAVLRQRAQDAGAGYVDTYKPSVGRDACSGRNTRWIEPISAAGCRNRVGALLSRAGWRTGVPPQPAPARPR
ncbi:GDSL-type esterase/lipase family protein [Streptomyces mirabilis]|uniref:GDSL-type esterase/lipase family protein n=1 Tax=Streptomyces mirabilis TaxID=68239 RepID=UPI00332607A4